MIEKIKKALTRFYQEFIQIKDTPQRIALSFGLGVFLGILPFTGVLAAIAVAWYFRLSKPAAILGSVITNTWTGLIIFGLAIKVGSLLLGDSSAEAQAKFQNLFKDFHWQSLQDMHLLKLVGAVAFGFLIVSLALGVLAYFICLMVVHWQRRPR